MIADFYQNCQNPTISYIISIYQVQIKIQQNIYLEQDSLAMSGFSGNDGSLGDGFREPSSGRSSFELSENGQSTATTVMNYLQQPQQEAHVPVQSVHVQTQTGSEYDLVQQSNGQFQIMGPNNPETQKLKSKTSPNHNSHSFHPQFGKKNQGYHSNIVQATDPINQPESKRISYQSQEIERKKFESQNRSESLSLHDEDLKELQRKNEQLQRKNEQLQWKNSKILEQKGKVEKQNERLFKLLEQALLASTQKQNKQKQQNEKNQKLEQENQNIKFELIKLQGVCEGYQRSIAIMNRNSKTSSNVSSSVQSASIFQKSSIVSQSDNQSIDSRSTNHHNNKTELIVNAIASTNTEKQIVPQEYLVCVQNANFIHKFIPCMSSAQINSRPSSNYEIVKIKPELISALKHPHDFLLKIQKDESKIQQMYYSNENYQIALKKKPQDKKPAFYLHLDRHKISVSGFFDYNWLNLIGLTLVKCSIDDTRWKRISSKAKDHLPHLKLLIIAGNPLEKVQKTDLDNFKSIREIHFSGEKQPQYKEVQKCPLSAESVAQINKFMQKREKKVQVYY